MDSPFPARKPNPESKIAVKPKKRPHIAGCCPLLRVVGQILPAVAGYGALLPVVANAPFATFTAISGNTRQKPKRAGHGKYNTSYFLPDRPCGACVGRVLIRLTAQR